MGCEHYSCAPYNPDQETVVEFLERFEVQMAPALHKTRNNAIQKAGVLLRALPVQMITDLQRRLAPRKLHEATYDDVTDNLCASYSTKSLSLVLQFIFSPASRKRVNQSKTSVES